MSLFLLALLPALAQSGPAPAPATPAPSGDPSAAPADPVPAPPVAPVVPGKPTPGFEAVDAATTPAAKAEALLAVIDDAAASASHGEAWARLGDLLADAGLPGAASIAWGEAFGSASGAGPYADRAVRAVTSAEGVGDPSVVTGPLAALPALPGEPEARSEAAYVIAREELRADNLTSSLTWIGRVDGNSKRFGDAEGLKGIALASQGKHEQALASLQSSRALGQAQNRGERYDTKVALNLARAYYGAKNWGQAIYHYTQVPRSSDAWVDANFERAWAHFRGQDMVGTLGLLHTPSSPFFDDVWVPESHMLRAQAMFLMCKFTSAIDEMDTFEARYKPVQEKLDASLSGLDAKGAFDDVGVWLDGGTPKLPVIVLRRYKDEDRLADARKAVAAYTAEAGRTAELGAAGTKVTALVEARRDALIAAEGQRVLDGVKARRAELQELSSGLELARIDILQLASRLFERAAVTGEIEHGDRIGKLRDLRKRQPDHQVWPFQGEYWADELGWYQVDAPSDCPESMARKVE